jgi:hypothetical protein
MASPAISTIAAFSKRLQELPRTLAIRVAAAAAPKLTAAMRATMAARSDAFGDSWIPTKDGAPLKFHERGDLTRVTRYVAIGTKIRVVLSVAWAKFQIGRRPIAPKQGESLPTEYRKALAAATTEQGEAELKQ